MADDGITLKIDADTARYIARIAAAAEKTKELHKPLKEAGQRLEKMNDFAKDALQTMTGLAIPMTVAGGLLSALEKGAEGWKEQLQKGRDALREAVALNQILAQAGLGGQATAVTRAMGKAAPSLKIAELTAIASGTTGAGGLIKASQSDLVSAAKAGALAQDAGITDLRGFAANRAALLRNGVTGGVDNLAAFATNRIGEGSDRALAMVAKQPQGAQEIFGMFAAARAGGKQSVGALQKVLDAYDLTGGRGSLTEFTHSGMAMRAVGRGGMDDLRLIEKYAKQFNVKDFDLQKMAEENGGDSTTALQQRTEELEAGAERGVLYGTGGGKDAIARVRKMQLKRATIEKVFANTPMGAAAYDMPNIAQIMDLAKGNGNIDYAALRSQAQDELAKQLKELNDGLKEQTGVIQDQGATDNLRRIRVNGQGENAP